MVLHKQKNCPKLEENKKKQWPGWISVNNKAWWEQGTRVETEEADKITKVAAALTSNFWDLLEQNIDKEQEEDPPQETEPKKEASMTTIKTKAINNKIVAHWVRKMDTRQARQKSILNLGAMSGAAPE